MLRHTWGLRLLDGSDVLCYQSMAAPGNGDFIEFSANSAILGIGTPLSMF